MFLFITTRVKFRSIWIVEGSMYIYEGKVAMLSAEKYALEGIDRNPWRLSVSNALIFVCGFSFLCSFCLWLSGFHVCLSLWLTDCVYLRVRFTVLWVWFATFRFPCYFSLWIVSFASRLSVLRVSLDLGFSVFLSLSSSVNSSFACLCFFVNLRLVCPSWSACNFHFLRGC